MAEVEHDPQSFDWAGVVDYSRRYTNEAPKTQYELPGVTEEVHAVAFAARDERVEVPVAVVPLWHAMVTARVNLDAGGVKPLQQAQRRLDRALAEIELIYPLSPAGILPQIAWGLPYFRRLIPESVFDEHIPKSVRAGSEGQPALIDTVAFPRDPDDVVLESNEVCFHFKSDFRQHIDEVIRAMFTPGTPSLNGVPSAAVFVGDLFTVTSIRRGFAGHGMPRRIGTALGIDGADKIPEGAMLFMGFTSSQCARPRRGQPGQL